MKKLPSTIQSSSNLRRGDHLLLRHTASGVMRMGIQLASMMILVPLIIRYLGEDRFGVWMLGMALVGGLTLLELGLLQAANRFLATIDSSSEPDLFRETFSTAFWLTLPLCFLMLLAVLPLSSRFVVWLAVPPSLIEEGAAMVRVLIIYAALSIPLRLFPGMLISQRKMSRVHAVQGVASLLYLLASWSALRSGSGLADLAGVYLSCMLLEHLAYLAVAVPLLPPKTPGPRSVRRSQVRRLGEFALFAWIGQSANIIFLRISVFLVQGISGVVATGAFSVASRLANISLELSNQAVAAGSPKVASLANQDLRRQDAGWLTLSLVRRSLLFSGPLAAVALPLGYPFLYGWVGSRIASLAAFPLAILVLDVAASMPLLAARNALAVGGRHRFANLFSVLLGFLYIPAAWLLGRNLGGPVGAALASFLLTLLIGLPVFAHRFFRHFGVRAGSSWKLIIWPHLLPFFAAVSVGLLARLLICSLTLPGRHWLWTSAGAAILAAGCYLLLYGLFSAPEEERRALQQLLSRKRKPLDAAGDPAEAVPCPGDPVAFMVQLKSREAWEAVKPRVQEFEPLGDACLYQTWSYAYASWNCRFSGSPGWLVSLGNPCRPVGLVFLIEQSRTFLRLKMSYLQSADHHVMRMQPLLALSGSEREALEALAAARFAVHAVSGACIVSLTKLQASAAEEMRTVLQRLRISCRVEEMGISHEILIGDSIAEYWNQKKAKSLYNLRRAARLLEERIGKFTVDRIRAASWNDPEFASQWKAFTAMRRRSWQFIRAFEKDPSESEALLSFDEEVLRDWADKGYLEITLLKGSQGVVAGTASCITGSIMWVIIQAFDEEYAAFSPGRTLFARLIDLAHTEGIRRWVLGPTCDEGKQFWANRMEPILKITFPLGGIKGRIWAFREELFRLFRCCDRRQVRRSSAKAFFFPGSGSKKAPGCREDSLK